MTSNPPRIHHDPLCPVPPESCCPWMGDCTCQCLCDFIADVRDDERRILAPYLTRNDHTTAAENRP